MLKAAFNASRSAGLLPAFGWTLLIVAVLAAGVGGWIGMRWEKGTNAIAEAAQLRADRRADRKTINELAATARQLQQRAVDGAVAYDQAITRMDAIASVLEGHLEKNREFTATQRAALADLLARRPDLRDLRLGDDVLRHWNRSNQGPATPAAAPEPAGQSANPGATAPAGTERRRSGSAEQPRRRDRDLPRVSRSQRVTAAGGGGMAGHRVELVLQRGSSVRARCVGVPQA